MRSRGLILVAWLLSALGGALLLGAGCGGAARTLVQVESAAGVLEYPVDADFVVL